MGVGRSRAVVSDTASAAPERWKWHMAASILAPEQRCLLIAICGRFLPAACTVPSSCRSIGRTCNHKGTQMSLLQRKGCRKHSRAAETSMFAFATRTGSPLILVGHDTTQCLGRALHEFQPHWRMQRFGEQASTNRQIRQKDTCLSSSRLYGLAYALTNIHAWAT